jgi:hypothetical protein
VLVTVSAITGAVTRSIQYQRSKIRLLLFNDENCGDNRCRMRLCATLTLMTFAATLSGVARADGHDPAAAESLFRDGRAAAQRGDWEAACPKLRESQRLDPAPGTLLNLADCEEHRGKVATAWQLFRQVVDSVPANDDRSPIAAKRAAALEKRLPHMTVRLVGQAPAGVKVTRNDVELSEASLGSALPVDPGAYTVTVSAPGRATTTSSVTIAEGASSAVEVRAGAPTEGASGGVVATSSSSRTAGWVMGGIGVAGLVVGGVAGILTLGHKSTVDDNCNAMSKLCSQTGYDAAQSGKTWGLITTTGLVVGALGVGTGAYLLLSSNGPAEAHAAVSAGWMEGGTGISLQQTW